MTDYSAEPPRYPDGHVCNGLCRGLEHCWLAYGNPDRRDEIRDGTAFQAVLARQFPLRRLVRLLDAPEAPLSTTLEFAHRGRNVYPGHEDAYRYWYTYPAHVEAAVRGEVSA